MAEKILNTRIQLKRDTLTNWNESSLVLKPGELAVAYVDVATKDEKGNIVHVPTAILKAGENVEGSTKTFKELPFVSAIAADVYAWAKEKDFYVETVGEGEAIAGVEFKATETHPNGALVVTKTDLVTPTELTNALQNYYTKGEIDALIAGLSVGALEGRIKDLEDYKDTHGDIVTHNANEFAPADIDTGIHEVSLTGGTNNGTVKLTVDGTSTDNIAVTGLGDAAYTTIDALNATAKGYADAKDTAIAEAKKAGDDAAAALDSYKGEMTTTLGTKADKSVVEAMYTNAKIDELLSAKQDVIPAETYDAFGSAAAVEKKLEDYTKTADLDTTIDGLGYLKAADIEGKADKATTLAGYGITDAYTKDEADTAFATPAEVISEVNKALADVSNADSITNITTLVEYVNENAADLTALITEVYGAAEMTGDSRIDTAVADAAQAKADAAAAVGTANDASTVAGEAKTLAEEAKEAATNATTGAAASAAAALASQNAAAQSEANALASENAAAQAKADAEAAKGAAEQAKADAEAAKNAASGSAANAATSESNAAGSAATASEQAGAASASAATANTAKEAAVAAQGAAETAQGKAETAQGKAEDAQSAAETARDEAVAAKEAAEASNTSATAIANQAKETANGAKTAADAATKAVAGLHAIAKSGNVNDLVQTSGDVLIFDCGTSTLVI